jgi:hypothetical protein
MTATEEQLAAAAAAVELGMQTAEAHWKAAEAKAGYGWAVALPSVPDSQGRLPQGLGFGDDVPADALREPERPLRLVPDYSAAPVVGGQLHHASQPGSRGGLDGVASWPAGQPQISSVARRASSMQYVGASSRETWRSRLREAWSALFGRS